MRLIDADALETKGIKFETHGGATFIALGSVRTAPTIDAVPVVRCGECKHWEDGWLGYCTKSHTAMHYDNFCSHGERKDGDPNG